MRVAVPGIARNGAPFTFDFEGVAVEAWAGESLGAALLSAGIVGLRTTARGEPRGLYCGMGVCGECRVMVDGVARRACMTAASHGQRVARAPSRAIPVAAAPVPAHLLRTPDVLVVGAGPAGLSAARVAAAAGLDVLVADERGQAGGQYYKQPATGFAIDEAALDAQFGEGRALAKAAVAAGSTLLFSATLWSAARDQDGALELLFLVDGAVLPVRPRRLVLATGAYERAWPVPGGTLPGVMTTGAAQTLLRAYGTAPGRRVLVAGNGPLNLQVACELRRAGVEVVALAEQARAPLSIGPALAMARHAPGLVLDGLRQLAGLARGGVPIHYGHVLSQVDGDERACAATVARIDANGAAIAGTERRYEVDAVCLGYGFHPQAEAARAIGCRFTAQPGGGMAAVRADDGRSSVDEVFIAGDGGGLGGARAAGAQGIAAGTAVANDLEAPRRGALAGERARALRDLQRHRAFQDALWRVYAPASSRPVVIAPAALLCRCESVAAGAVDGLVGEGVGDLGAVKRASRLGMGACQARYCGPLLAARLDPHGRADPPGFAPRPPFKPIPISAIAGLAQDVLAQQTNVRTKNIDEPSAA
jgi:NADPH-dependent 2,4-dienoyl-CoA reductase/sulfur reductase-like enzyme